MYAIESMRSDEHGRHERADWWRHQVTSIQVPMSIQVGDGYRGGIVHQRSSTYQLVRWWGDAESITRRAQDIRRHPHDAFELIVPLRGAMKIGQDGSRATIDSGQMLLTSLDRPLELEHGDGFCAMGFVLPAGRIATRFPRSSDSRTVIPTRSGIGKILTTLLRGLHRERDRVSGHEFDAVSDRIVDLLPLCWTAGATNAGHDDLVDAIRRTVRENAHDPGLTGAEVAAKLGWSLRHVQTHLQRIGTTPSQLIREERLALARLRLQDPAWRTRTVTQVAYASGFGDLSTFSTAYRRHFGERPSETLRVRQTFRRT